MIKAIIKIDKPPVPDKWDYGKSVQRVKAFVYKWENLTEEIAQELWIAREVLSIGMAKNQPRNTVGAFVPTDKNWTNYCEDIGSSRQVVNRWLKEWFEPKECQLEEHLESDEMTDTQKFLFMCVTLKGLSIFTESESKIDDALDERYQAELETAETIESIFRIYDKHIGKFGKLIGFKSEIKEFIQSDQFKAYQELLDNIISGEYRKDERGSIIPLENKLDFFDVTSWEKARQIVDEAVTT